MEAGFVLGLLYYTALVLAIGVQSKWTVKKLGPRKKVGYVFHPG